VIITTREEQAKIAAAARWFGGYDKLITASEARERMSPDEWRRQFICEPAPPPIYKMTHRQFEELRKMGSASGVRIRRHHRTDEWMIDDGFVEFIPEPPREPEDKRPRRRPVLL
jgi:hypothetical protein